MARKHLSRKVMERFLSEDEIVSLERKYQEHLGTSYNREADMIVPLLVEEIKIVQRYITKPTISVGVLARENGLGYGKYSSRINRILKKLVFQNKEKLF